MWRGESGPRLAEPHGCGFRLATDLAATVLEAEGFERSFCTCSILNCMVEVLIMTEFTLSIGIEVVFIDLTFYLSTFLYIYTVRPMKKVKGLSNYVKLCVKSK